MKRTYFLSDAHLGAKSLDNPLEFERRLVRFLDSIKESAEAIYLLGDIIDFWFEYKTVVPRGFTRFFGKIAELTDRGIKVHWFTGNHDIWIFDYLPSEIGVTLHRTPMVTQINGKKLFLAHGDGLGDHSWGYRLMNGVFHNPLCQRLFAAIHPRWSIALAHSWSKQSRLSSGDERYTNEESEHLIIYAKQYLKTHHVDFFIFGHRHIMLDLMLSRASRILVLGDWISFFSYAVMEGDQIWLEQFEESEPERELSTPRVSVVF